MSHLSRLEKLRLKVAVVLGVIGTSGFLTLFVALKHGMRVPCDQQYFTTILFSLCAASFSVIYTIGIYKNARSKTRKSVWGGLGFQVTIVAIVIFMTTFSGTAQIFFKDCSKKMYLSPNEAELIASRYISEGRSIQTDWTYTYSNPNFCDDLVPRTESLIRRISETSLDEKLYNATDKTRVILKLMESRLYFFLSYLSADNEESLKYLEASQKKLLIADILAEKLAKGEDWYESKYRRVIPTNKVLIDLEFYHRTKDRQYLIAATENFKELQERYPNNYIKNIEIEKNYWEVITSEGGITLKKSCEGY